MSGSAVEGSGRPLGTQTIERAFAVLACFEQRPDLAVREIAQATGLTGPTAHRIIRALHRQGFLEQDPVTDTYHLGYGAALLGRLALERLGFTAARPILSELARETGEAVSMGVRVHDESVVVIQIPSAHPLRIDVPPGKRNPLYACAMGKVLLAHGAPMESTPDELPALTPLSITSASALAEELERIRQLGYSVNDQERSLGTRSVGAPVQDARGTVVAAISLQAPVTRFSLADIPAVAVKVQEVAAALKGLIAHTSA
jgi:IclR family transcriptional regulator, acetate operon repressor